MSRPALHRFPKNIAQPYSAVHDTLHHSHRCRDMHGGDHQRQTRPSQVKSSSSATAQISRTRTDGFEDPPFLCNSPAQP